MIFEVVLGVLCIFAYYYIKFHRTWTFWKNHHVEFIKPSFPFGSSTFLNWETFISPENLNQKGFNQAKALGFPNYFGTYFFQTPVLAVCDPELAKYIMAKDFDHFVDRQGDSMKSITTSHFVDQLWGHQLTALQGDEWKITRNIFTPVFTAGKLKGMMHLLHVVTNDLVRSIGQEADHGNPFELKEKFGKFSMDTIASCAFGVNANSFNDPKSTFASNARVLFRNSLFDFVKFVLVAGIAGGRTLMEKLNIPLQKKSQSMFFYDIITQTIDHRLRTKIRRNDLVDLMLDALLEDQQTKGEKGSTADGHSDADGGVDRPKSYTSFDELRLVATAFVILIAGYDTTAQTLAITSFYLARNPDIQEKLFQEIKEAEAALEDGDEYPDYHLIQSLPYLDMVLHETLRINPALGVIARTCTKDYQIPGTNISLKRGYDAHIYVSAIHKNPDIYPDPDKYDPERFTNEAKSRRHPYSFLGFGQGPRNCIGMRFALLEAKLALFGVLKSYRFVTCKETIEKFTLDPTAILAAPKEPLLVKVVARS